MIDFYLVYLLSMILAISIIAFGIIFNWNPNSICVTISFYGALITAAIFFLLSLKG